MSIILHPDYGLYEKNDKAFCDSLQVAGTFGRQHKHIMATIEKLGKPTSGLTSDFSRLNFELSNYKDQWNRKQPKYFLSKDGFTMVVMEFKTAKARAFKEAYITRFNQMEEFIKSLLTAKLEFPAFTEAVMLSHDEPKHYHFSNEVNMIYRIVLGVDAKTFRGQKGIEKGAVIRPYLDNGEIKAIETLQRADIGLLAAKHDYVERKVILENYYAKMQLRLVA